MNLTQAQASDLQALCSIGGWWACRPGSNFLPLCEVETPRGDVPGEAMEALHRLGAVQAEHRPGENDHRLGGCDYGPYGHIPEFDLDWVWSVTDLGRRALSPTPQGGDDAGR